MADRGDEREATLFRVVLVEEASPLSAVSEAVVRGSVVEGVASVAVLFDGGACQQV
jgi:hypothetical protein